MIEGNDATLFGPRATTGFGAAVEVVAWAGVIMRVAQFLLFSTSAPWRRVTFAVLSLLLLVLALTSGLRMT